jgi:uncharacterized protein YjiS (DUF1127 family)
MSFLSDTSNYAHTPRILKTVRVIGRRFFRAIEGCIAQIVLWRERQAALTVLRSLNDRALRDIGLDRGQIGAGLADAAKYRSLRQNIESPSKG